MLSPEELLANNRRFAAAYANRDRPSPPARRLVVLTCMDARMDPLRMLGLQEGDAHILRNAGGRATDDALRSIVLSQQVLGTRAVLVIHHTGCGLADVTNEHLRQVIGRQLGTSVDHVDFLPLGPDPAAAVRADVERVKRSPLAAPDTTVWGYLYDVRTGRLTPVA